MTTKYTEQLNIRWSPEQNESVRRMAALKGISVANYIRQSVELQIARDTAQLEKIVESDSGITCVMIGCDAQAINRLVGLCDLHYRTDGV